MNLHDAEQLLGGYATGTLTEAERRALFAAALEHQPLFDALADEEALRELLADPAARAELLAALTPEAAPSTVRPFWRRHPGVMGLAASLLVAVTAGVAYLRTPQPALQERVNPQKHRVDPSPAKPASPTAPAAEPPQALGQVVKAKKEAPKPEAGRETYSYGSPAGGQAGAPPPPPAPTAEAVALPQGAAAAPAPRAKEDAKAARDQADFAALAPGVTSAPVANAKEETERARARAEGVQDAARAKKAERKAVTGALGSQPSGPAQNTQTWNTQNTYTNQAAAEAAPVLSGVAKVTAATAVTPTWSFEIDAAGVHLLRVHHAPGRWVYVLQRTSTGPRPVSARIPATAHPGFTEFPLPASSEPLDLYVFPAPPLEPLKLPAKGPVSGFRARIQPPAR